MIIKKFILFLIRSRLGLMMYETFRFSNQKTEDIYCFVPGGLLKFEIKSNIIRRAGLSNVSLNWLLDDRCGIRRVDI